MNYIEAISNIVISDNSEKTRDQLADAQNQLPIVGSLDVVGKLMIFHDFIKQSNMQSFTSEK